MSLKNTSDRKPKSAGKAGLPGGPGPQTSYTSKSGRFAGIRDSRPKASDPRQTAK